VHFPVLLSGGRISRNFLNELRFDYTLWVVIQNLGSAPILDLVLLSFISRNLKKSHDVTTSLSEMVCRRRLGLTRLLWSTCPPNLNSPRLPTTTTNIRMPMQNVEIGVVLDGYGVTEGHR